MKILLSLAFITLFVGCTTTTTTTSECVLVGGKWVCDKETTKSRF